MTLGDAGSYYCSADNGLGHVDKEELLLDVQYGPQVPSIVQCSTVQYIVQYNIIRIPGIQWTALLLYLNNLSCFIVLLFAISPRLPANIVLLDI